jgi:glycerol-1-phosphate dehydrogenase [NAD(P)+]
MAKAGLGDMLAKYVSICEWRLSNLINGEYYCEEVAEFTRQSLRACVNGAKGLLDRDPESMKMLFEGLINCGKAMDYAGCSRPGGGVEHYFSHIWDMRGLDFGTPTSSHGMQVALGTLNTIKCYQELKNIIPNREKALAYAKSFDFADWSEQLRTFVGKGAEAMIALEAKEKKYDLDKHAARLEVILEKWDDILRIIDEELPSVEEFEAILDSIEAPKTLEEIGLDSATLAMTCKSTKDIRDKYVLPRLLWDIGELDSLCEKVFG